MQKVITINLNGNAYQLDESAYRALRFYLDNAEAQLAANPDKAEILADLEQAIADKCKRFLGPGKTVVSEGEIDQVLREIGPVDGGHGASQSGQPVRPAASAATSATPKRLYQIREGAMFSGVCNGSAAYLNLDPTIVRVAFTLAAIAEMAIFDRPPWIVVGVYLLLMFLVPYAKTSGQLAAAQGAKEGLPYRVQEMVERVKGKLAARRWPWEKKA
jgi:phage shock protein PspC (stress-responsive transcriptional regulator)